MSQDSRQDELSADALRSLRASCIFVVEIHILEVALLFQQPCDKLMDDKYSAQPILVLSRVSAPSCYSWSSSVYLVQPSRKATLIYALSESNMPADVPPDCVSLHSSLILKVILGRFCSDYSCGRANNQPWARIHLWGTSAGNNTKVDAPGTQHQIKNVSSFSVFLMSICCCTCQ